jgi:polyphosphate glucokinase
MSTSEALGIDIGGSALKAAPVDVVAGKLIADPATLETGPGASPAVISKRICDVLQTFSWTGPVGIGYPGVVKNGVALSAANVSKSWLNVNIRTAFQNLSPGPVTVINDADAAGLAEMAFGAGKERNGAGGGTVLMLTFGTGIGSALFVNGSLVPNTEFGHLFVEGVEAELIAAASIRVREELNWETWAGRVNRVLAEYEKLLSPDLIIFGGGITENFDKFGRLLHTRAELSPARMR